MGFDEGPGDCKAESRADVYACCVPGRRVCKRLEGVFTEVLREPRALVAHCDLMSAPLRTATLTALPDGVWRIAFSKRLRSTRDMSVVLATTTAGPSA